MSAVRVADSRTRRSGPARLAGQARARRCKRITALFSTARRTSTKTMSVCSTTCSCRLIDEIEAKARAELARPAGAGDNAPLELMRRLAKDDDIAVAGPVLDAVAAACRKPIWSTSPAPRARRICSRSPAAPASARRSPTCWSGAAIAEVVRNVADNRRRQAVGERLLRAGQARGRRRRCWPRRSASGRTFRRICSAICWCGRPRWCSSACSRRPSRRRRRKSSRVLAKVSERSRRRAGRAITPPRSAIVLRLHQAGKLDEAAAASNSPTTGKFEETVAALSLLCGVPIDVVDRLMSGERPDPILILCKAAGFSWPTARRSSWRARQPRARRARRSTPPSPISSGCRHRPRSAWCGSGRRGPSDGDQR